VVVERVCKTGLGRSKIGGLGKKRGERMEGMDENLLVEAEEEGVREEELCPSTDVVRG
jgi:hypothetical protein